MKYLIQLSTKIIPVFIFSILINAGFLLLFSYLIETSVISLESSTIIVITSLIVSMFLSTYIIARKGTRVFEWPIISIIYILILFVFQLHSGFSSVSMLFKMITSIIIGTFIGKIFGSRKYNKLRNSRKYGRATTK